MKTLLLLLSMVATVVPGRASIVVLSNFPNTSGIGAPLSTTSWAAVGVTSSAQPALFDSMAVYLTNSSPSVLAIEGGIYSDNSGTPGTLLASFVNQNVAANTSTPTLFTMATATPYTLSAATSYWFVLHDFPQGIVWVRGNPAVTPTASGGYTYVGYKISSNTGSTWSAGSQSTVEISVTPTPEPSSFGAFAIGLLAFAGIARRTRRS
jgi:hypothetical protein